MQFKKSFFKTSAIAIAFLASFAGMPAMAQVPVQSVSAQENFQAVRVNNYNEMRHERSRNTIYVDRDFYYRNQENFGHHYRRVEAARNIIIIDRRTGNRIILINNYNRHSVRVNTVTIVVNHSTFLRLVQQMRYSRDVRVSVNTGNNFVAFNTVVGNITTGDVNISVR